MASPHFPPPPPLPAKVRMFQRTPPAMFPPVLGLFGLGLAWRRGAASFGLPEQVVELFLGAVSLLFLFCLVAYGVKIMMRAGVVAEDLRVLPGRTGLVAATMCLMLLAAVLVPYAPALAGAALILGFLGHLALATAVLVWLIRAPAEARQFTPAMHLVFVGFIVAPGAAVPLGYVAGLSILIWYCALAAVSIASVTLGKVVTGQEAPPLRPLHAIHLAPGSLVATGAFMNGQDTLGLFGLGIATATFLLLLYRARWMTVAGFSGFWSAFTFPFAAFVSSWFAAHTVFGWESARIAGGLLLVAATLIIPPIAAKVLRLWAEGKLAAKTNAAIA